MKILFVVQNFQLGGIPTAFNNMLKELLVSTNDNIEVMSFGGGPFINNLPAGIVVHKGDHTLEIITKSFYQIIEDRKIFDILLRLYWMVLADLRGSDWVYSRILKRQPKLEGYDVAVSYFDDMTASRFNQGTLMYVADFVQAKQKISWSHTDPINSKFNFKHYQYWYSKFQTNVCVSDAMKKQWMSFLGSDMQNMHVIHNFMDVRSVRKKCLEKKVITEEGKFNIVTVARIDNISKRIDRIIEVVKILKKELKQKFIWRIVGDGPDRKRFEALAAAEGVLEYLDYVGFTANPYPYIYNSQLFVLVSDFEGLPMVIRETQILGIPPVCTDFFSAFELISDGVNGKIVGREPSVIADAIIKLAENCQNSYQKIKENLLRNSFDNSSMLNEWEQVIKREDN